MDVEIRGYRPVSDHPACRSLWAEFTLTHRKLYNDETIGGSDPGAEFENYLTKINLSGMWVALSDDTIVGFTGLVVEERHGEVQPLVVAESARQEGVGNVLLERVTQEATKRGLEYLTIQPMSRNTAAVRCALNAGFDALSHITLTKDLKDHGNWEDGVDLLNMRFKYLEVVFDPRGSHGDITSKVPRPHGFPLRFAGELGRRWWFSGGGAGGQNRVSAMGGAFSMCECLTISVTPQWMMFLAPLTP